MHGIRRSTVKVIRRRIATDATTAPRKKPRIVRRIVLGTSAAVGTFYVGSTFIAFNNQKYYDFFSDNVPLGQSMLEYAESHGWDTATPQSIFDSGKKSAIATQQSIVDKLNGTTAAADATKQSAEKKAQEARRAAVKVAQESKAKVLATATALKTQVEKNTETVSAVTKHQVQQLTDELGSLVKEAENAISGIYPSHVSKPTVPLPSAEKLATAPTSTDGPADDHVYTAPLPVGFEPPPGFSRPTPPKPKVVEKPTTPLPLVAPVISALNNSDPILSHLAGTIDELASYLKSNPQATTQVSPVLENAKTDLSALAKRIEQVRDEERVSLEAKMDEQTREYTVKLLEFEMSAQDNLDSQENDFRKFFDQEKAKLVQAYQDKIDHELRTQTELINERLKEEVIAQGIELQRRWIREIKVRVEQERGGRLAKLDELSAHLKRLERVALDNSAYLDENIRIHALWSAVRAVSSSALASPVRKPFREELRVLRHIAAAREDPVVSATLDSLDASQTPDIGVEPFADLASWFATSVAPKVSNVALVPTIDAGVLSHLASHVLSTFRFKRQGLVEGSDVLSVIARAEYYLNEKDLDSAARELNQLEGTPKLLLHDWLEAARRRLEVEQALDVVQTQASLASLLVV